MYNFVRVAVQFARCRLHVNVHDFHHESNSKMLADRSHWLQPAHFNVTAISMSFFALCKNNKCACFLGNGLVSSKHLDSGLLTVKNNSCTVYMLCALRGQFDLRS